MSNTPTRVEHNPSVTGPDVKSHDYGEPCSFCDGPPRELSAAEALVDTLRAQGRDGFMHWIGGVTRDGYYYRVEVECTSHYTLSPADCAHVSYDSLTDDGSI